MNIKVLTKKIKEFGTFETICLITFAIIVLLLATVHENYQEEAQSWLMARELGPLELLRQLKYEGHSFLWFYILMPFAKLGFPMQTQNYITAILGIMGAYLVLKKSPFNKVMKLLIVFSGGMIYFYSILARPYALAVLILYAIATMYNERKQHPYKYATLIALLAQTHLVMLPVVFWLTVFFWGKELTSKDCKNEDKIELVKSLTIILISIVILSSICFQTLFYCAILHDRRKGGDIFSQGLQIKQKIKNAISLATAQLIGKNLVRTYYKYIIMIPFLMCLISSRKNIKFALIFWSQVIFTFLIHSFIWVTNSLRVYMAIYMLIFWLWLYKNEYKKDNRWLQVALIMFLVITTVPSYNIAIQDLKYNYSDSRDTAMYIKNNIEKKSCFICVENDTQQSIIGYLPREEYKFYQVVSQSYITYITWDDKWNTFINKTMVREAMKNLKNEYKNLYILSMHEVSLDNVEFVYTTDKKLINNIYNQNGDEIYYIYKVLE